MQKKEGETMYDKIEIIVTIAFFLVAGFAIFSNLKKKKSNK